MRSFSGGEGEKLEQGLMLAGCSVLVLKFKFYECVSDVCQIVREAP